MSIISEQRTLPNSPRPPNAAWNAGCCLRISKTTCSTPRHVRNKRGRNRPLHRRFRAKPVRAGRKSPWRSGSNWAGTCWTRSCWISSPSATNCPATCWTIVDETRANWFHDVLGVILRFAAGQPGQLRRAPAADPVPGRVARQRRLRGPCRPMHPPAQQSGLAVRIIAPKQRVEHMMQRRNLEQSAAAQLVDELDAARAEFCRRHFHRDIQDPLEYDLVINTARLSVEAAAELIVDAFASVPRTCRTRARRRTCASDDARSRIGNAMQKTPEIPRHPAHPRRNRRGELLAGAELLEPAQSAAVADRPGRPRRSSWPS